MIICQKSEGKEAFLAGWPRCLISVTFLKEEYIFAAFHECLLIIIGFLGKVV